MKGKLKKAFDNQAAIVKGAIEAARAMTVEEQTQYDALDLEIKGLEKTIAADEAMQKRIIDEATPVTEPIFAQPNEHKPLFKNFGDQLQAIKLAATPGGAFDNRLMILNSASGASEGVASDGGFLVEKETVTTLLKDMYDQAIIAPRTRKLPIGPTKNGIKLPYIDETSRVDGSRQGGVQAYWEGEADALNSSKPKYGILELDLKKLTGLYYATDELLQDTVALQGAVTEFFGEEFAFKVDDAILRGTGAGMPLDILNSPALITVAKTASQTADTVTFNNCLDMWTRCRARNRANAIWFINQEVEPQLQKMIIATGTYSGATVYMPPNGIAGQGFSTLFGRPVLPIEQAAALGDAGDIILMDPSEYLMIEKGGMQAAASVHVRFLYDESVFRFILRIDGQPRRKAPLTPYKGANTLSPFITLAARA